MAGPRHVLVLGATGFLGGEMVDAFRATGAKVRGLARRQGPQDRRARDRYALLAGDASDPAVLANALVGVDHVVDALGTRFAAASNRDPVSDAAEVLPRLVVLLEALALRPSVGLTLLSSGGTVYGNPPHQPVTESTSCEPITSYGVLKVAAEKYVNMYRALHGVRAQVLRVANAYGPRQVAGTGQGAVAAFMDAARTGETVVLYGDGKVVRDYVSCADVADAAVGLAARGDSCTVNVGTGTGTSLLELLELVGEVTGRSLQVERRPGRNYDVRAVVLDVALLQGMIDWRPSPLREGLRRIWTSVPATTLALGSVEPARF